MRLPLVPAAFLLLGSSVLAQYTPPINVNSMMASLHDLKNQQEQSVKSLTTQSVTDFSNAAATESSAVDFYCEAIRVTQFAGAAHEQTAFRDWEKKEVPKLNGPAIRACLRYMVLSIQRADGATDEAIFPSVLAYAQETQQLLPSIAEQAIVRDSIAGNIFARWYNLGDRLGGLNDWELDPGDVDGIYTQFLLPFMRQSRDQRILQYWDSKLATETAQASSATAAFATDTFNQNRRPVLLWSRAEDMVAIGLRDQGINTMYTIVKTFPTHPSAGKWIDELEGLIAPPPGLAPGKPGTPAPAGLPGAPVPAAGH